MLPALSESEVVDKPLEPETPLSLLRGRIEAIDADTPADDLAAVVCTVDFWDEQMKLLKAALSERKLEWLKNDGKPRELVIGETRHVLVNKKKVVCPDKLGTLTALFDAAGGDMEKVADCIASAGLKHGACRTVLGDAYANHFDEIVEIDEETKKPRKQVLALNEKFIRKGVSNAEV